MTDSSAADLSAVAYLGLGSNLGDRAAHLAFALARLADDDGIELLEVSDVIETAPVGGVEQPAFLNAVCRVATSLAPRDLLCAAIAIEAARGRRREQETRWGPRVLDIDVILYADRVIDEPGLRIPHPRLASRAFVLVPLAQLAPDLVHPETGATIGDLAAGIMKDRPAP